MKKYNLFLSIFVVYLIVNMVLFPKLYIETTFNGIKTWALSVLPSVLPFMVFTKLLTNLGFTEKCSRFLTKPCKKLFNCTSKSSVVFFTSIISGYPVGAAMTADLYQSGKITKSEAFRMCSFCSTSGPMFIIGAVGVSLLGNVFLGYIIFFSHILGALFNGLIYRNIKIIDLEKPHLNNNSQKSKNLSYTIQDSVLSILSIGAIIAIFFVVITSLSPILHLLPPQISCILEGMIEITKGCTAIACNLKGILAVVTSTAVVSFGGFSTILQSMAILTQLNMPIKIFILQKTTHAILAMGVSIILCLILL